MGLLLIVGAGDDEAVIQRVRDTVAEDTPLTRRLKRKIHPARSGISHPQWADDPDFDVETHIIRHDLNAASSSQAFNNLVADIVQMRMSLDKPLWEVHIISGLSGGETAIVGKLHHALADGATGMLLIQHLMGINSPRIRQQLDNSAVELASIKPSNGHPAHLNFPMRLFFSALAWMTLRLFFMNQYLFKQRLKEASNAAPYTRFNGLLGNKRSYTHGELPLEQMRTINSALDCSRNDVFLAIVSGALRSYLLEHDELPERSVYTGLPLALLGNEQRIGAANQLTFYRSSLATNIADPKLRLAAIKKRMARSTVKAKEHWNQRLLERLALLPPSAIKSIITIYIKLLSKKLFRPNVNVVSTLLPGPAKTTYVAGREVVGIHPVSIPYHGAGLFISAIRYRDKLQFGIIADDQQLPDPEHLADLMRGSLDELLKIADE